MQVFAFDSSAPVGGLPPAVTRVLRRFWRRVKWNSGGIGGGSSSVEKTRDGGGVDCGFCPVQCNCRHDSQTAGSVVPVDRSMRQLGRQIVGPVVVVGVSSADTLASRPLPMHSNPKSPLQLRRFTVQVENALKGGPLSDTINVYYYFTWVGAFDEPRPLGQRRVGDRRILWLRWDSGVLRTICDGWDGCTRGVESGAHRGRSPDPQKSRLCPSRLVADSG